MAEPLDVRHRAYRTELDPNPAQVQAFLRHAGSCRYIYNWALSRRIAHYEQTGETLSVPALNRALTELKQSDCPWLYEVSNAALQNAIRHLDSAYRHFFRRVKAGETPGFPRFKSKKRGLGGFTLNSPVHVEDGRIKLPRIGWVRLKERGYLPAGIGPVGSPRITSATVTERAGRWYVSIAVEEHVVPETPADGPTIAAHLGVRQLATTSDGEVYSPHASLERSLRKLKRAQRALSRKQKGSANREKARRRVAKIHASIANQRTHALHQVSHAITKRAGSLVLESWDVAGMLTEAAQDKRHGLARRMSDEAVGELRRQLLYKAQWRGVAVVLAPVAFPSSMRCSQCGAEKRDLGTTIIYHCTHCGLEVDREQNSVRNLMQMVAGKQPDTGNASGAGMSPGAIPAADDEGGTH